MKLRLDYAYLTIDIWSPADRGPNVIARQLPLCSIWHWYRDRSGNATSIRWPAAAQGSLSMLLQVGFAVPRLGADHGFPTLLRLLSLCGWWALLYVMS